MEDKDIGVNVDDVLSRIYAKKAEREEEIKMATNKKILDSLSDKQYIGRACRGTTASAAPVRTITMADIDDAAKKLGIRPIKRNNMFHDYVPLEPVQEKKPIGWKLASGFSMSAVSLVSNPEPGCEIQNPETAFDYAMKLVEK